MRGEKRRRPTACPTDRGTEEWWTAVQAPQIQSARWNGQCTGLRSTQAVAERSGTRPTIGGAQAGCRWRRELHGSDWLGGTGGTRASGQPELWRSRAGQGQQSVGLQLAADGEERLWSARLGRRLPCSSSVQFGQREKEM